MANADLMQPIINVQVVAGDSKAGFGSQRILLIAQGSGTNTPKALIENVQGNEVVSLCGAGSMATRAFRRIRDFNNATDVDIITLEEPSGGTNATGSIKASGTADENKTLRLNVGDDLYVVNVTILKGDIATTIATKIRDAINNEDYPFTATVDANDDSQVNVEFDIKGEMANGITIVPKNRLLGVDFTVVPFSGGAGAYDTADLFDNVTKRYQTVLFDKSMDFDTVEDWLQDRINVSNTVKGGVGITMMNGDYAGLRSFCEAKNSQSMVVIGNVDTMKFNALPLLAVAEVGAIRALRLTDGAIISKYVLKASEVFGGINKSSLPYFNTPLSYDQPQGTISIEDVTKINNSGVSLFVPSPSGAVLGTVTTLYKRDKSGIKDQTFKFLNAVDTSFAIQEYLYNNTQKEFGQTRATGGDLVEGVAMTNELSVKAFIVGLYEDLVGFALAQGGGVAVKTFKNNLTVKLDTATGTYSIYAPTPMILQLRGMNITVAISYNI